MKLIGTIHVTIKEWDTLIECINNSHDTEPEKDLENLRYKLANVRFKRTQ